MSETPVESESTGYAQCDPCRVQVVDPVTKKSRPCGHVGKNILMHLQAHNKKGSKKKWNKKTYLAAFPDANIGTPSIPSPESQERLAQAREKYHKNIREAKAIDAQEPYQTISVDPSSKRPNTKPVGKDASYAEKLQARFEVLWDQVNRDVPAEQFARDAARAEFRIEELQRRIEAAILRADWDTVNKLQPSVFAQHEMLKKCMDFLDLTVKNRRDKNQLGNDTVAQLISNYGATLRRWSPEKRESFNRRVAEVRRIMEETRRQKLLSEILEEQIDEVEVKQEMSEAELNVEIEKYIDGINGV